MKKSGFTLIEIIVVVGILGIIMVMGSNLFFSILRGSTKTKILQLVKQNGDYAISVMGRMIRNARRIEAYDQSYIRIKNPDGETTTFRCCGAAPNFLIASESGTLSGTLSCENARLTNDEVKVDDCSNVFSIIAGEVGARPDVVTINFTLSQAGVTTRLEEQASVNFQTTVSLRNY